MLDLFQFSDFAAQLNTKFQMHLNEATVLEIELVEVAKHGASTSPYQFSLRFAAPLNAPLAQGIFKMRHDSMGEQQLFLVPVARDNDHLYYEAVFNSPQ
ncbi:MAG: hypothetical protein HY231_10575 [Acidobacteria bacterium]|nr:hypothetical protein [Acidobacteriota bacterium]